MDAGKNGIIRSSLCSLKLLYPLLLTLFLLISNLAAAQDLSRKISIQIRNQPLGNVIKEISNRGEIHFSFSPQSIPTDKIITFKARNKSVKEILDKVFLPIGISWSIVENQIVLKKVVDGTSTVSAGRSKWPLYTISGYVKDSVSGEVLIGANIYAEGTSFGATTNGYGFYSLTLQKGKYRIVFSYLGYKNMVKEIDLENDIRLSEEMEEAVTEIGEVEVTAKENGSDLQNNQLSEIRLNRQTLQQLPGFAGDLDFIRALQAFTGIQTFGDGSSFYFVRGGKSDQNLLLIDEVPVYNPSHLFGFFSAFSPDAINDMQILKGDFPAKYGGRLSSVIDIKAKEGNMKRFGVSGNIGPYASTLSIEGPIIKERSSFFLSGRVSTVNWLSSLFRSEYSYDFIFFDINAKVNFRLNDKNRYFLTFYYGQDDFSRIINSSFRTYGISWNNMAGTFRWNHIFSNKLFSNTTVSISRYNYYLFISEKLDDYWISSIANLTGKTDFTWYLNPHNTIRGGLELTSHYSNPGNVTIVSTTEEQEIPAVAKYHSANYILYLGNEQHLGKKITLKYGIRLPVWQDFGPATVYYFNTNHQVADTTIVAKNKAYSTFFSPEPRISFLWSIDEKSAVKASYGRMTQFLQILSNSVSPFNSLEIWAPGGPNIQPQKSDQVSMGYFRKIWKSKLNISGEIFYKYYYNNIDYRDHANLLYNPLIEGELRFGNAWSYGVELMIRKTEGKLTGWIGYTYSRSFINTPGVNNDEIYCAYYDRPNDICINIAYSDKKRWAFTANWVYLTGIAITSPVGFYYNNGYSVPVYGDKNNDRLPDYHRLDVSATYMFSKPDKRFQHSLTITLYNAYGRMNPFSLSFNKIRDDQGNYVVPADNSGDYQLIPTTVSVAGIIPSINYQFRF